MNVLGKGEFRNSLGGVSLGDCAQKGTTRQLGIHVFVVAYRNTTHYSIEAP